MARCKGKNCGSSPAFRRTLLNGYGGTSYSAEAIALFDRWTALGVPAPDADKPYVDASIVYLKSTGEWNTTDYILKFDVHNKTAALVNWKNPSGSLATITNDYGGSFTAYVGFTGNGTNFRITTAFNPGDGGTYNYTQNSCFHGFYNNTVDALSSKTDYSASTVANQDIANVIQGAVTPKKNLGIINSGASSYIKIINQMYGWHFTKRTGATAFSSIKNGQDTWTTSIGTIASRAIPNLPVTLFCRAINNTTFTVFSAKTMKGWVAGGGTTDLQELVNGLNIYSLGVNSIPKSALIVDGNSFTANGEYLGPFFTSYTASNLVADFIQGTPAKTTAEMITTFPTTTGLVRLTGYTKSVYVIQEITNDMPANASNVTTCYNNVVSLVALARATYGASIKIGIVTCLPRGGTAPIVEANRQNAGDLYDVATINGRIRTNYLSIGADFLIDWGSDPIMGVANAYTNPTYYNTADEVHPTTVGYGYLNTNWFYPAVSPYL